MANSAAMRSASPLLASRQLYRPACGAHCSRRPVLAAARQQQQQPGLRPKQQQLSSGGGASCGPSAPQPSAADAALTSLALWALAGAPAWAADAPPPGAPPASSYYVSLGLFLITVPGLWSLIKRSPKAKIKRKTFEVAGPAAPNSMPLDERARQVFGYFKRYNYSVKSTGDVIVFEGKYAASLGQAAALVLYTLVGLASTALVLSITIPAVGGGWYGLCALSPAAGWYYYKNADRTEEMRVKMVTSDDDAVTDITLEGDDEEIERFWRELGLSEKGKVRVEGLLG